MDLSKFDFELPENLIAVRPVEPRDACRLLKLDGRNGFEDLIFRDIVDELQPGDILVANDTRVLPTFLTGSRPPRDDQGSTVAVDLNLLAPLDDKRWSCLARPGKRLKPGDEIRFQAGLSAKVENKGDEGEITIAFSLSGDELISKLEDVGRMPIPPYIQRLRETDDQDREDYQTVFAERQGSVAAPTAGLHFTDELINAIEAKGVGFHTVTLHVGAGTFKNLSEENLKTGRLHEEWCEVSAEVAEAVETAKAQGNRVIAVGTTALRTLEARSTTNGVLEPGSGETDIFIQPGYEFKTVSGLITNFHLPRSSLFMLVSALIGTDVMQSAYSHAIASGYRFYSYGDACLLLPGPERK